MSKKETVSNPKKETVSNLEKEPKATQKIVEVPAPPTIQLGDLVRDVTSGYEGLVISITAHLFGDPSVQLQQYEQHRKEYKEPIWLSGKQLRMVEKGAAQRMMG